jgi:hypothetical protein
VRREQFQIKERTAEEKAAIVLGYLKGEASLRDTCRQHNGTSSRSGDMGKSSSRMTVDTPIFAHRNGYIEMDKVNNARNAQRDRISRL